MPFSPASLPNLALWYSPRDGATVTLNGSKVSALADKSGRSRNATQSNASYQPTYSANGLNGYPCLVTSSASNTRLVTASFQLLVPATIVLVASKSGGANNQYWFDNATQQNYCMLSSSSATNLTMYAYSAGIIKSVTSAVVSAINIYVCVFNGTSSVLDIGLSTEYTGTTSTAASWLTNTGFLLGCAGGAAYFVDSVMGDFVVYSDAKNSTDRTSLINYMKSAYGLLRFAVRSSSREVFALCALLFAQAKTPPTP